MSLSAELPEDFPNRIQQLDHRILAALQDALRGLREEVSARLKDNATALDESLATLAAGLPTSFVAPGDVEPLARQAERAGQAFATAALRDSFAALDRSTSQAEVLSALLVEAGRFASRAAVFLARTDAAQGWGAYGFQDLGQSIAQVSIAWSVGGAWSRLAEGRSTVVLGTADCAWFASRLESHVAQEAVLVPLVLADRVAAALYADRVGSHENFDLPALQALVYVAGQTLELLALRSRPATPTLLATDGPDGPEVALALWRPEEVAPAPPEPASAAAPPPVMPAAAAAPPFAAAPAPAAPEPAAETPAPPAAPAVPAAPARPLPFAEAEEPAVRWEETAAEIFGARGPAAPAEPSWEAEPAVPAEIESEDLPLEEAPAEPWRAPQEVAAAPLDAWTQAEPSPWEPPAPWEEAAEPAAAEEPAVEPMGAEAYEPSFEEVAPFSAPAPPSPPPPAPPLRPTVATAEMRMPDVDLSEDATLLVSRRPVPAPPAPPAAPAPPLAAAPVEDDETRPGAAAAAATRAMPRAGGPSPEVAPPTDFFGPGLAFAGRKTPAGAEEALHEEARRLARLLVSEIRLYNEELVEEGRRNRDIYSRLKDEIDRSRKMYDERIAPEVRAARDYFGEELVRRLADGDAAVLGI